MTRKFLLISVMMWGCARKPPPVAEAPLSDWAKHPPVLCPGDYCVVWRMDHDVSMQPGSVWCFTDPKGYSAPGRLIAVDPSNPRVIVVSIHDGCYDR